MWVGWHLSIYLLHGLIQLKFFIQLTNYHLFRADFAAALTNPIAYQSQLEKHAQQLAVLEDNAVRSCVMLATQFN